MDANQPIIPPVPREELESELTKDRFVRYTNKGENKIYDFTANDAPALMREVGRLREESFRTAGGGTGKEADIDDYDTGSDPYHQLIVWDPGEKEILGGYRYIMCDKIKPSADGQVHLATGRMFHFTEKFIREYLPYTIELGRSFVQPQYQSSKMGAKSLYALDNLWDGLGSLIINHPHMRFFFGKVTMYAHSNLKVRSLIRAFMDKYFSDPEKLVYPYNPVKSALTDSEIQEIFSGKSFSDDYKILSKTVRELGENIPPLINAYMNLSPSMKTFGTSVNERFGGVEETGIIITIKELYQAKVNRHVHSYKPDEPDQ
ncbi:MAG: GNAT family N-acetyltransferase [Marinilabilia sp.]